MRAVLTFHAVDDSGSVLSIAPRAFRGLMEGILASGHRIVPLSDLLENPADPHRVALTFDDGFSSVAQEALPILQGLQVSATLLLTTGVVGDENRWPSQPAGMPVLPLLGWGDVERLQNAGWEIGAHSVSHPDLRGLQDTDLNAELGECQESIRTRLGCAPRVFAYPYGFLDPRVVSATARHYRFALTTRMGALATRAGEAGAELADPLRIPRVDGYYLKPAWLHRRFGSGAARGYLLAREIVRGLRHRF